MSKIVKFYQIGDLSERLGPCTANLISGQAFGKSSLAPPFCFHSSYVCLTECDVLVLNKGDFRRALHGLADPAHGDASFDVDAIRAGKY
jgi:hypothetical protein